MFFINLKTFLFFNYFKVIIRERFIRWALLIAAMAIKLYTLRHEESEYNALKLITGNDDPELTQAGLENADRIGNAVVDWTIHRILTGQLIRQRKTAQAISRGRGIEIDYDARMNERGVGRFQRVPYNKIDTEGLSLQTYLARKDRLDDDSNPQIPRTIDPGQRINAVRRNIRSLLNEKVWPERAPDDESILLVVSELWNVYFANELFGNPTSKILGLCSLDNGHYNEYSITILRDEQGKRHPEERIVILERGNAPLY